MEIDPTNGHRIKTIDEDPGINPIGSGNGVELSIENGTIYAYRTGGCVFSYNMDNAITTQEPEYDSPEWTIWEMYVYKDGKGHSLLIYPFVLFIVVLSIWAYRKDKSSSKFDW